MTVQFIGILKDFLISQRTKISEQSQTGDANTANITRTVTPTGERSTKELFLGLQTAIDLNPHKIIIGLDGNNSQTSAEQLSLIRDKLVGSLVNLTVTDLSCDISRDSVCFDRDLAERIIKLNMNPFNKIIEAQSSSVQGHSRSTEYANERRQEAQRFLQFVRAVRAGKVSTKLLEIDEPTIEILQFHPPDSRLNTSIFDWIRLNGITAQGLNIWNQLDVVSSRESTYVPVLGKEVESRAMKQTPGQGSKDGPIIGRSPRFRAIR